jgi:hypothetical protein
MMLSAGEQLADLRPKYEQFKPWTLTFICPRDVPYGTIVADPSPTRSEASSRPMPRCASGSDSFRHPPETHNYRLGNLSTLDRAFVHWKILNYKISIHLTIVNNGIKIQSYHPMGTYYVPLANARRQRSRARRFPLTNR